MKIHTRSKSSLFLTEMILSVLFFSIAAACCIQIFVQGHLISQKSENLNYAQNLAVSMAETIMTTEGDTTTIHEQFPEARIKDGTVTVFYDKNWEICEATDASFLLKTTFDKTSDTLYGNVIVSEQSNSSNSKKDAIYQLPFRQHVAQTMTKEEKIR